MKDDLTQLNTSVLITVLPEPMVLFTLWTPTNPLSVSSEENF